MGCTDDGCERCGGEVLEDGMKSLVRQLRARHRRRGEIAKRIWG